ncbi:MAG: LPS export ABC transporter permease LptF [Xanthomonadales bacterium]|nr:LPS export ABC transporter permease LptF [Xanthomonadales bacterium]
MSILQKYVLREWLWTFLAVSFVLMLVILGSFLGEMFNDIADGRMPPGVVGIQLLLYIPEALGDILPLAAFVSIMWGLGRLYRDREMAVMRASGFSWRHLVRPLLHLTLPVAALLLVVELSVAPRTSAQADKVLDDALRTAAVWGLQAGQFHVLEDGSFVIYVQSLEDEGRVLSKVFVHQRRGDREQVWFADRGEYWLDPESGDRFITLEDGEITDWVPGNRDIKLLRFSRNDLRLPEIESRPGSQRLESQPSADLLADGGAAAWAELQWRLMPAVLTILLSFLAIPMSHSDPREGRGSRVTLGILSYALYANTLFLCRAWVADGTLPVWSGLWWPHLVVTMIIVIWLRRQGRFRTGQPDGPAVATGAQA